MNQITSTLIAAVFGGFFSIVPATFSPSAANDSVAHSAYTEGNFYGTVELDASQVEFAAPAKWLCFDVDSLITCYRSGEVPYPEMRNSDLVWVGDGDDTHPHLPASLR